MREFSPERPFLLLNQHGFRRKRALLQARAMTGRKLNQANCQQRRPAAVFARACAET